MKYLKSIEWINGKVKIIDQTKLPEKLEYKELSDIDDVIDAIINMRVRGAPLLGVTAALGLALVAYKLKNEPKEIVLKEVKLAADKLRRSRPTAINLFWAIDRILKVAEESDNPAISIFNEAKKIIKYDLMINNKIADVGQRIIKDGDIILTHCNTGSLATVSIGTALGVIIRAWELGKKIKVYFTETRPLLQGSRLTGFELIYAGVPSILICDSAVGHVLSTIGVTKVLVGADRILSDGTTYNKIGTFQIAVLANIMKIPFYVVAPTSTFDMKSASEDVHIEERSEEEIKYIFNKPITPIQVKAYNPAFDKTPPKYITGIITEKGIIYPPFKKNIPKILSLDT